jgi:hypothetical protein
LSFLLTLKERTKEKAPEMTTSAHPDACYTSLIGATGWAEVRAHFRFARAPALKIFNFQEECLLDFNRPQNILGKY